MSEDLGDFQTPLPLVEKVISCLTSSGKKWTRALEPTCGKGNFIKGLLNTDDFVEEVQGIEIQDRYVMQASTIVPPNEELAITIRKSNIFDLNLGSDVSWRTAGQLLVIGNPPWITNAALSTLQSSNLPTKSNFKKLRGLDAITGGANFDIAEYIILKLIFELASEKPTIAMLCKTGVARNILAFASTMNLPISGASIRKFDSKKYFGVYVDACLFCIDVGLESHHYQAAVYQDLDALEPSSTIGLINGQLVSNLHANRDLSFIDGACHLNWRQGLKHDAAPVIELVYDKLGNLRNKLGELVDVESAYVYPLLKSSDLGGKEKDRPKRAAIVTQTFVGEDTKHLQNDAPNLWRYLHTHKVIFERRKSSIYTNQPAFSMFGLGNYSFSLYKVAISGLYKSLKFSAIGPINDRPVIFDDTCYFIACESAQQAALIASLLNDPLCHDFIQSVIFWDAKRPITKKLLQRINLQVLFEHVNKEALLLRIGAELAHMGIINDERDFLRLEDLKELLQASTITSESHFGERSPSKSAVFQMSLLEADSVSLQ